jgi:hypothetical protein
MKAIAVYVNDELHNKFKLLAAKEGKNFHEILIPMIEEWIKEHEKEGKNNG